VQEVYTLKTAPAFEAAMYAGLRMGYAQAERDIGVTDGRTPGTVFPGAGVIRSFCRYVGAAYQVQNDLKDWEDDGRDKVVAGQDLLALRPTMLLSFAFAAGDEAENGELRGVLGEGTEAAERLAAVHDIFEARGVFDKAHRLVAKYRQRARAQADGMESGALRELMHFIVSCLL
jgi:geranylgeranyl pyrophosphate synthase